MLSGMLDGTSMSVERLSVQREHKALKLEIGNGLPQLTIRLRKFKRMLKLYLSSHFFPWHFRLDDKPISKSTQLSFNFFFLTWLNENSSENNL